MTQLHQASTQWATRPDDERFVNLIDLFDHFNSIRSRSREVVVPANKIAFEPLPDNKGLVVTGPNGHAYSPTHHAFGQLSTLAGAPAGYLRTLPSPLAADNINYGLKFEREEREVGVLLTRAEDNILRCATGPNYGRVWNADVAAALVNRFGNGRTGDWQIPGEFGKAVKITKDNTTLYGSDRDMFVFLADEQNRIHLPGRRGGNGLARGFFCWNSEVGDKTLGIGVFLFDYACCNRIVWGARGFKQITIKHTSGAPDRWIEEVIPVLDAYQDGSSDPVEAALQAAASKKIDDVAEFLANRFGKRLVAPIEAIHQVEEGRPIETLWDAVTGATAYARGIQHQDLRVILEQRAGEILDLVAA